MFRFSFADPAAPAQHAAAAEPEAGTIAAAHEPAVEVMVDEVRSAGRGPSRWAACPCRRRGTRPAETATCPVLPFTTGRPHRRPGDCGGLVQPVPHQGQAAPCSPRAMLLHPAAAGSSGCITHFPAALPCQAHGLLPAHSRDCCIIRRICFVYPLPPPGQGVVSNAQAASLLSDERVASNDLIAGGCRPGGCSAWGRLAWGAVHQPCAALRRQLRCKRL